MMPRHFQTTFFVDKEEKAKPGPLTIQPDTIAFRPIPEVCIFLTVEQFRALLDEYQRQSQALNEHLDSVEFDPARSGIITE